MQGLIRLSRRWAGVMIATMLLPLLLAAGAPVAAQPSPAAPAQSTDVDPQVARSLAQLRASGETQFDFSPTPPTPQLPQFDPPEWLIKLFNWLGGDGQGLMTALAYLLLGVVIFYILYLFVPAVRDGVDAVLARWRKPKPAGDDGEPLWQPDALAARNLLMEADRLAAAGQFNEAVHLLLGRSLEELSARRPGLLKPAQTARTIAALDDLPLAARQAFGGLARAVERGFWAQRPLGQPDWQQARADYADFALGSHWQGAPA